MSVDGQKKIWSDLWSSKTQLTAHEILFSEYVKKAYACIGSFFNVHDKLILEAGCGTGRLCCRLAKDFPDSNITGMDISEQSLNIARTVKDYVGAANVKFESGNLFAIAYPDDHFDVVFNEGVIEHFALEESPSYLDAIAEMLRVTKHGGKLIISVPNWYCLPHTLFKWVLKKIRVPYKYGYEKSFKQAELKNIFEKFSTRDIEMSGFFPAHPLYNFGGRSLITRPFNVLAKLVDCVEVLDSRCGGFLTKKFGVHVVIRAVKP